jgi:hypothetical protein
VASCHPGSDGLISCWQVVAERDADYTGSAVDGRFSLLVVE